jgi:hypothetical protein
MKKQTASPRSGHHAHPAGSAQTLGRERFAKISAVEGIELSPRMKKRVAAFDRQGSPPRNVDAA